jgi:DNA-binding CsgD family transcriptional regulator
VIDVRGLLRDVSAPTLVIHDPSFPFGSLELCREVASGIPDARLLTVNDRLMMGGGFDETLPAIDRFLRLDRIEHLDARTEDESAARGAADDAAPLTRREQEVLRLIASGHQNKAIAAALGMSERTVARHITNLYAKIGINTKAAATAYAIRHGLA